MAHPDYEARVLTEANKHHPLPVPINPETQAIIDQGEENGGSPFDTASRLVAHLNKPKGGPPADKPAARRHR